MKPSTKLKHWQVTQRAMDTERERIAFLNGPLPKNDPKLFVPTRCKVLRAFYISGKPAQPGEVVSLPWHVAMDMKTLNKVQLIE